MQTKNNNTHFVISSNQVRDRLDVSFYTSNKEDLLKLHSDRKRIADIADVVCGPFGSSITQKDYVDEGIPFLRITNLKQGRLNLNNELKYISSELANKFTSTQVHPGDIVVSQRGTLGEFALIDNRYEDWNISANLIAIKNPKIDSEYLNYYLNTADAKDQLTKHTSGQVQQKITTSVIKNILVPIPETDELSKIKLLINNLEEIKARKIDSATDEYLFRELGLEIPRKQIAKKWFSVPVNQIETRIDATPYHPDRINAIQAVKAGKYQVFNLSEVVDFQNTQVKELENHRYVGLENVESDTGTLVESPREKISISSALIFTKGDILFAKLRPYLNKVLLADFDGICSTEFHVLRCKDGILPQYLRAYLASDLIVRQTSYLMTGNTLPRLQTEDIKSLIIPLPDVTQQEKIVNHIQEIKSKTERSRIKNKEAEDNIKREIENILFSSQNK